MPPTLNSEPLVYQITNHIRITNAGVHGPEGLLFPFNLPSFDAFAEWLYKEGNSGYSKFHKMDRLCKLGFLATEFLLHDTRLTERYDPYDIGIHLSNANSSLDTDIRHQRQIESGFPSPSVFVYTLPNIVIGELCIRHGIKGENMFFIQADYDIRAQVSHMEYLLRNGIIASGISGWLEIVGEEFDCFLYIVESRPEESGEAFTSERIEQLYYTKYESS